MRSIALADFEHAERNVAGHIDELTQVERFERPRRWVALILPFLALLLWLLAGSLITWLVADFDRALAPAKSTLPPWFVFLLFFAPAIVVGWLFVRSWKRSPSRSSINE